MSPQQQLALLPVHTCAEIDLRPAGLEYHILLDGGVQKLPSLPHQQALRRLPQNFPLLQIIDLIGLILIVDIDIPGIVVQGPVLVDDQFIEIISLLHQLPLTLSVIEADDAASLIQLQAQAIGGENSPLFINHEIITAFAALLTSTRRFRSAAGGVELIICSRAHGVFPYLPW